MCSAWRAEANVYRFSSREIQGNSGFYYCGFRFYGWANNEIPTYTNVIAGTKTVTIVGTLGQMITNSVYDIASGLLTTGSHKVRVPKVPNYFASFLFCFS